MEKYLYAGILAKMVKNTHKGSKWAWQGGRGPHAMSASAT